MIDENDRMDKARVIAAQCWCTEETEHIKMNVALAEVFAEQLAAWMRDSAMHQRHADYWRSLVEKQNDDR